MRGALLALALAAACARDDAASAVETAGGAPRPDTASARQRSGATTTVVSAGAAAGCPATGLWAVCAVVERLDRAGLAPRIDSTAVAEEAPLTARGTLIRIGRAELELFVYPDAAARERAQRALDASKYLTADAPMGMTPQPTLLHSANLIAILHSRNDHQRERVSDAVAAGPPQPARP